MAEDKDGNALKITIITVIGGIVVAVITGIFGLLRTSDSTATQPPSQGNPVGSRNTNTETNQAPSSSAIGNQQASGSPSDGPKPAPPNDKAYEVVKDVGEDQAFVDPETGFVFSVEEITDWLGTRGVFSFYTFPNGQTKGTYRWPLGHRDEFEYQGRRFYFVIQDINYNLKTATIKIKEIPNQ